MAGRKGGRSSALHGPLWARHQPGSGLISNFLFIGITWGKVVSLYSVAAGLAVDCVRQAQPAMVHALVDCLGEFVRKTLATWLRRRGGWVSQQGYGVGVLGGGVLYAPECENRVWSGVEGRAAGKGYRVTLRHRQVGWLFCACTDMFPDPELISLLPQDAWQNKANMGSPISTAQGILTSLLGAPLFCILKKQDLEVGCQDQTLPVSMTACLHD